MSYIFNFLVPDHGTPPPDPRNLYCLLDVIFCLMQPPTQVVLDTPGHNHSFELTTSTAVNYQPTLPSFSLSSCCFQSTTFFDAEPVFMSSDWFFFTAERLIMEDFYVDFIHQHHHNRELRDILTLVFCIPFP